MKQASVAIAAVFIICFTACVEESGTELQGVVGEVQTVKVIGPSPIVFEEITGKVSTKGTSVQDGSALLFNWALGDTLGIFPNQGNQVEFPITGAQGSTSASFDGGGWALRNNASYAAYYPFSVWNYHRDNETILLDYSGQVQNGNGSFAHLSAYDYLASNKTTPQNSSVTFQMERQGSIMYIDIVVPEPETITALTISCNEPIFVEKASLDISGDTPVVTPIEFTESLTLSFENTETTTDNETVRAYMAVQPLDFNEKTVIATLYTATGSYTAPVTPRVVNKGRAAFLRFSESFSPVNIEFADAEVKRICVENWDTNDDGELSYKEAAAVTDLNNAFNNTIITTFNELQYFISLTEIKSGDFSNCQSLQSLVLPESIVSLAGSSFHNTALRYLHIPKNVYYIDKYAIYYENLMGVSVDTENQNYCSYDGVLFDKQRERLVYYPSGKATTSYSIPDGVLVIGECAFYSTQLSHIDFPETLLCIERSAFRFCENLLEIGLPDSLTEINMGAFENCIAVTNITIPRSVSSIRGAICNGCGLQEFNVVSMNVNFKALGGVLFNNSISTLVNYPTGRVGAYYVPEGVEIIGRGAFKDALNLSSVVFPSTLKYINSNAFTDCQHLTELTIPESVERIDGQAFMWCRGLTKITINNMIPFTLANSAFEDTGNCPIYVPNESVEAYKAAAGWSEYAERIFGIDVNGSVVGPDPQNPD